jgi:antirestriction protein ArdC
MNAYDVVLNQILDRLREGTAPWRSGYNGVPANYFTGRPYRGINRILLSLVPYELPWYLSFLQVRELGGSIRAGEHGHLVCFFKDVADEDRDYDVVLRYYRVWNIGQTTLEPETANRLLLPCEKVYANMPDPPLLSHDPGIPRYVISRDEVVLPPLALYEAAGTYYATLFHELVHSTGHPRRLCRFSPDDPPLEDRESYSLEELVAEIGSSFLCAETGILPPTIDNNSAYIAGWLRVLEHNRSYLFRASSLAQKAVDLIRSGDTPPAFFSYRG